MYIKDGGLRRKEAGGIAFGSRTSVDKKKSGGRVMGRGKENLVVGYVRSKGLSKRVTGGVGGVKSRKRPRTEPNNVNFLGNL